MKVRIKEGAKVYQDFAGGKWPWCKSPCEEFAEGEEYEHRTKHPNAIFEAEWNGRYWTCRRDGYGDLTPKGNYGNGSISVLSEDGVEAVNDAKEMAETILKKHGESFACELIKELELIL